MIDVGFDSDAILSFILNIVPKEFNSSSRPLECMPLHNSLLADMAALSAHIPTQHISSITATDGARVFAGSNTTYNINKGE